MMIRLHNLTTSAARTSRGCRFVGGFEAKAPKGTSQAWYGISNMPALDPKEDSGPTG